MHGPYRTCAHLFLQKFLCIILCIVLTTLRRLRAHSYYACMLTFSYIALVWSFVHLSINCQKWWTFKTSHSFETVTRLTYLLLLFPLRTETEGEHQNNKHWKLFNFNTSRRKSWNLNNLSFQFWKALNFFNSYDNSSLHYVLIESNIFSTTNPHTKRLLPVLKYPIDPKYCTDPVSHVVTA